MLMKKILFFVVAIIAVHYSIAQDAWRLVNENLITKNLFTKTPKPKAYSIFQLNEFDLQLALNNAPSEKQINVKESNFLLSFPNENGILQQYRIVETYMMEEGLARKYPNIKSYIGLSTQDNSSSIRFSFSPEGFQGMLLSTSKKQPTSTL